MDEGLTLSVVSYEEDYMDKFSVIGLKLDLTEEGLDWYEEVILLIFQYIEILK